MAKILLASAWSFVQRIMLLAALIKNIIKCCQTFSKVWHYTLKWSIELQHVMIIYISYFVINSFNYKTIFTISDRRLVDCWVWQIPTDFARLLSTHWLIVVLLQVQLNALMFATSFGMSLRSSVWLGHVKRFKTYLPIPSAAIATTWACRVAEDWC